MSEILKELIIALVALFIGGFATWFWSKRRTKSETEKDKYTTVNEVLNPLLESIKNLTERNNDLSNQLIQSNEQKLAYYNEIITLKGEVNQLKTEIKRRC